MRRKLVAQGPSTLTISLPKSWADRFNLEAGEEVEITEQESQLTINTLKKIDSTPTTTFDFNNINIEAIRTIIVSIYKAGLKDITLTNVSKEKFRLIKQVIDTSIGFEILDTDKDKIRIVDLGISEEEHLKKAEQQIYWKLLNMLDNAQEGNKSKDLYYNLDMDINKLAFFIQRNIGTRFSNSNINFLKYEKIGLMESLGDHLRDYGKLKEKPSKEEKEFLKEIIDIINNLRSIESKFNLHEISNIKDKSKKVKARLKKQRAKKTSSIYLVAVLENISDLIESIIALNIQELKQNN